MLKVTIGLVMQRSGKKHPNTEFKGMTQQAKALNNLAESCGGLVQWADHNYHIFAITLSIISLTEGIQ